MEISYQYTKLRKDFGRHPTFTDFGAEMLADIRPNEEYIKNHIAKRQINQIVQVMPEYTEHEAQTNQVLLANKSVNHVEGGWPKEVDHADAEHTIRYRKKIEKDGAYMKAVESLGKVAEQIIQVNNAIDIYEEYFDHGIEEPSIEPPHATTIALIQDPAGLNKRSAQYLSWHPDGSSKLVIAYSNMNFQGSKETGELSSYIWDVNNPNTPEFELKPFSALTCANYNIKDVNIIGAGQYNGQVCYFDIRKGNAPVESSRVEHSHRDPVYDLAWMQSKTGTECMSVSSDGTVFYWDIRKLAEPVERLTLTEKGGEKILGAVSLEYSPQAGPTKFMVGTEQGVILSGNWRAKTPADRIGTSYSGHHGPVYALVRSPFFPKYLLSVGDWAARMWNEDLRTPVISSKYSTMQLTGAKWSPKRPGVFLTTRADGYLDVWDYYDKQSEPALSMHVSDDALASLRLQESGRICAVGSTNGTTSILRLSKGLVDVQPNEKRAVGATLDRETNREKNLEKAVKEAKIKARREAGKANEPTEKEMTQEEIDKIEREFLEATRI